MLNSADDQSPVKCTCHHVSKTCEYPKLHACWATWADWGNFCALGRNKLHHPNDYLLMEVLTGLFMV